MAGIEVSVSTTNPASFTPRSRMPGFCPARVPYSERCTLAASRRDCSIFSFNSTLESLTAGILLLLAPRSPVLLPLVRPALQESSCSRFQPPAPTPNRCDWHGWKQTDRPEPGSPSRPSPPAEHSYHPDA